MITIKKTSKIFGFREFFCFLLPIYVLEAKPLHEMYLIKETKMAKFNVNAITAETFAGPFRFVSVEPKYAFNADRSAPKVQETSKKNDLPVWKVSAFSPSGIITVSVPHPSEPQFDDFDYLEFDALSAGAFSGEFYWRADAVRDLNV